MRRLFDLALFSIPSISLHKYMQTLPVKMRGREREKGKKTLSSSSFEYFYSFIRKGELLVN
jgi:hypothetical protein